MTASLCIHGHFYQPPREDPWLGKILHEASAAPMRHWNERILRESYAPMAWARRLDSEGRIADILNCYEWMSFNAGPTLLNWMRRSAPEVAARMRDGDAISASRWGHGNALAQVYHHAIMPLASQQDKELETAWAIADFQHHFNRQPEGMWLAECAVDIPSLECLAAHGITFVILAPRQAKALRENGHDTPVHEGSFTVGEPYRIALPSGAPMTAMFYHGGLSQGIAFEGLLRNGDQFWRRIAEESGHLQHAANGNNSLLTLATDGETYGHHVMFGEMALAHVLSQGYAKRDGLQLTNSGAYIATNPPTREIVLHEPSSWSCVHGVERWRSNCGCTDGGHPDWNQRWRDPLREALNTMRHGVAEHFAAKGAVCFTDAHAARKAYGSVLADPQKADTFAAQWFVKDAKQHDTAWKLLVMEEQALAAFASCAWFFDDISRIEPENGLTFALRAMELAVQTGGADFTAPVMQVLESAHSNKQEYGTGKDIFLQRVMPRKNDPATLCLLSFLLLAAQGDWPVAGKSALYQWPSISVEAFPQKRREDGTLQGTAIIRTRLEQNGTQYTWSMVFPDWLRQAGTPFTLLSESFITVYAEGTTNTPISRTVSDFSRPMRDYLLVALLEKQERLHRPEQKALAAHALSMTKTWLEAQHDVVAPELWIGFLPYLVPACMDTSVTEEQRNQTKMLLDMHLADRGKRLAKKLVTEEFLAALQGKTEQDATLAAWVRNVKYLMPDMDWWAIQNTVWEQKPHTLPELSQELGFR